MKVKVIWNVVGFVKGSIVDIEENVYKAYGEKYFEIIEKTEEKEVKNAENKAMKKKKAKTK